MTKRNEYIIGHYVYLLPEFIMKEALGRLHPLFRQVLVFRDIEGCTYKEIVKKTGLPQGTVASRIHGARREFRKAITAIYKEVRLP